MLAVKKYFDLVDAWSPHDIERVYMVLIQAEFDPDISYDAWRGLKIYAEKKCHCQFK